MALGMPQSLGLRMALSPLHGAPRLLIRQALA